MFRGGTSWLLSRNTAVAALGFLLSLIGALGSAFYLEPAQSTEDAASQEIVLKSAQAQMLRAATAYDDIAGHLGSLLFSVSLPRDASDDERAAIGDLMRRALDHRHDGVRTYLAALAVAGRRLALGVRAGRAAGGDAGPLAVARRARFAGLDGGFGDSGAFARAFGGYP